MGWFKTREKCEGYIVGLVRDDDNEAACAWVDGERFRELGHAKDRERCEGTALQIPFLYYRVACDCGWRSPVMRGGGSFAPFACMLDHKTDEDRAVLHWTHHHDEEIAREEFGIQALCDVDPLTAQTLNARVGMKRGLHASKVGARRGMKS